MILENDEVKVTSSVPSGIKVSDLVSVFVISLDDVETVKEEYEVKLVFSGGILRMRCLTSEHMKLDLLGGISSSNKGVFMLEGEEVMCIYLLPNGTKLLAPVVIILNSLDVSGDAS